jgi:hypothetical protein
MKTNLYDFIRNKANESVADSIIIENGGWYKCQQNYNYRVTEVFEDGISIRTLKTGVGEFYF